MTGIIEKHVCVDCYNNHYLVTNALQACTHVQAIYECPFCSYWTSDWAEIIEHHIKEEHGEENAKIV